MSRSSHWFLFFWLGVLAGAFIMDVGSVREADFTVEWWHALVAFSSYAVTAWLAYDAGRDNGRV